MDSGLWIWEEFEYLRTRRKFTISIGLDFRVDFVWIYLKRKFGFGICIFGMVSNTSLNVRWKWIKGLSLCNANAQLIYLSFFSFLDGGGGGCSNLSLHCKWRRQKGESSNNKLRKMRRMLRILLYYLLQVDLFVYGSSSLIMCFFISTFTWPHHIESINFARFMQFVIL